MAEKQVLVGLIPQVMVIEPDDQVCWLSDAGSLRIEFDVNRCPFSSNVFQAPAGMRLLSGAARPGTKDGTYKYRLWLNDQMGGKWCCGGREGRKLGRQENPERSLCSLAGLKPDLYTRGNRRQFAAQLATGSHRKSGGPPAAGRLDRRTP